jgi:16S rRNA (guanine527-N7)-methyltransferase
MIENVILDSLLFLRVFPPSYASVLDIGSGAGIPGIPIKVIRPKVELTMVESRGKRASFLASAVRSLGLTGARVVHGRAEAMIERGARFDVVVARCAGSATSVLNLGSQLSSSPGLVVVSGAPDQPDSATARCVRIINPVTGLPRSFLVRDVDP